MADDENNPPVRRPVTAAAPFSVSSQQEQQQQRRPGSARGRTLSASIMDRPALGSSNATNSGNRYKRPDSGQLDSLVSAYLSHSVNSNITSPPAPSIIPSSRQATGSPSPAAQTFKKMSIVSDSHADFRFDCVCARVIPSLDTIHCGICHNTIQALYEKRRDRLSLLDQLDQSRKELEEERAKQLRIVRDNQKLTLRIKELEDALDIQADEAMLLRQDIKVMSEKLVVEASKKGEVQTILDRTQEEMHQLQEDLFQQADKMVSTARRSEHRWATMYKELREKYVVLKQEIGRPVSPEAVVVLTDDYESNEADKSAEEATGQQEESETA